MHVAEPFIDIHCHLLPGIDDGARSWDEALEMAQMAVANGIGTVIATPHQGGSFAHNTAETIEARVAELQQHLDQAAVALKVLPGADVRFDADLLEDIGRGNTLTLAKLRRHLLLDLPHERYIPLDSFLLDMETAGIAVILSHPERNQGLIKHRATIEQLVDQGCLMQITSGSLLGNFGPACQDVAMWMLSRGLVHFVATDAHGMHARRPLLRRSFERVAELVGRNEALQLYCRNPARVAVGGQVVAGKHPVRANSRWFRWKAA